MLDIAQLARVKAKAEEISLLLPRYEQAGKLPLGVEQHRFQMNPPASLEEVEALELEFEIRLPEDYRAFLLEVGNGGAGPWSGLVPLQDWMDFGQKDLYGLEGSDKFESTSNPAKSYLASSSFLNANTVCSADWSDACWKEWDPLQGTITLTTCWLIAMAAGELLIVSGESRGKVVSMGELFQIPVFPNFPDFLSWYENWQDFVLEIRLDDWYRENFALWQKFNPVQRGA